MSMILAVMLAAAPAAEEKSPGVCPAKPFAMKLPGASAPKLEAPKPKPAPRPDAQAHAHDHTGHSKHDDCLAKDKAKKPS